jgi:pimeloyl-ACP methyl ester carboxylesterase
MRTQEERTPELSRRSFCTVAAVQTLGFASLSAPAFAAESHIQTHTLSSGRNMSCRVLGAGDKKLILIHGFPGTSKQFTSLDSFLRNNGITAIAPDLYGSRTDWQRRHSVTDAGKDIADLSEIIHGENARPIVLCVSGGAKDGIATTAALNQMQEGAGVSDLFVVSGQMDLGRSDAFCLLNAKRQFELNAIRGVRRQAHLPLFQPFRNAGGNLRQRIAHERIERLAENPHAAFKKIVESMSKKSDWPVLNADKQFKQVLFEEIASYSKAELINSLYRLFHWDVDFHGLQGTAVTILHGTDDPMVHPYNARLLEQSLRRAGVQRVQLQFFNEGHLLLKAKAEEIGGMIADQFQ